MNPEDKVQLTPNAAPTKDPGQSLAKNVPLD